MHLVLVDNLVFPERDDIQELDVNPHLGLVSLAAVAQLHGHTVSIIDPKRLVQSETLAYDRTLYAHLGSLLLGESPDAVGFTTLGCSFILAVKVAAYLKRIEPELPILLGGPHATILHHQILERFQQFDVVVRHEAEETLPAVLAALSSRHFANIPGVSWRSRPAGAQIYSTPGAPKVEDLDTLPIPAFDLYPIGDLRLKDIRVEAGRGCPFSCTFCSTASFFQREYRLKSPVRILQELDLLHHRYGIKSFKLSHDLFTVNKKKVLAFCEAVRGRAYTWRVSARIDCVDAELLRAMSEAGCESLYFGIETGSERIQKISQKRLALPLVATTLDTVERLGMKATVSFITGYPEETEKDQDATLNMLAACFRRQQSFITTQLHLLLPEPGTELYNRYYERLRYDGYTSAFNAKLLEDDDEQHVLASPDIFATYFYYPGSLPRRLQTLAVGAWRAFTTLGPTILSYILRYYYGRLSGLFANLRAWASDHHLRRLDSSAFLDFFADQYGRAHHVTSLVRYAVCTSERAPQANGAVSVQQALDNVSLANLRYCLSKDAYLLDDLHDCGALIERIERSPHDPEPFAEDSVGAPKDYLIIRRGDMLFNYAIQPALYRVLLALGPSKSSQQRACGPSRKGVTDVLDEALRAQLLRIGALVVVGPSQGPQDRCWVPSG